MTFMKSIQKIIFMRKNLGPNFSLFYFLGIIIFGLIVTSVTMSSYLAISHVLADILKLQDLLIIITLIIIKLFHRTFADERYYFASYSYFISGVSLSLIFAFLAMEYTVENPVITGQNIFVIGKYAIDIKSSQEMGAMYGLVFLQAFDTLMALFTLFAVKENEILFFSIRLLSINEKEMKFISIIMILLSVLFIFYTMSVIVSITLV